jgi:hypothetical protein
MVKRHVRVPPALKHGGYSGTTLLPGENPVSFEKLHNDLIAELAPVGRLEEDIVASIARLVWRKQNLSTYRLAEQAKNRRSAIYSSLVPQMEFGLASFADTRDPVEVRAAQQAAEEQARKELGNALELVEMGDAATTDHLLNELSVVDRLEGMIDRCLKRLLFVRGLKSISTTSSASTPAAPPVRIRGPSKAT